jgi:cobalt-zinc-cadmium efflux system protein
VLTAMALSATILFLELGAAYTTGSLALLSDAGHILTDLSALTLAYFALRVASRPATAEATFGYLRAEVLAAFVNGLVLMGIVLFIVVRAFDRLADPLESLNTTVVLVVATLGLAVNLVAARLLHADAQHNINTRGAYLDVLADAVASVGVVVSALLVRFTGNLHWDTYVSFLVAGIISIGAIRLIRSASLILLEATPSHVDLTEVKRVVESVPGVVNVHDLHVWTLTPGQLSATLHVSILRDRIPSFHYLIRDIEGVLAERFGLHHCTIQVEPEGEDPVSDAYDPVSHRLPEPPPPGK